MLTSSPPFRMKPWKTYAFPRERPTSDFLSIYDSSCRAEIILIIHKKTCHLPLGNRKTVFFSFLNLNGAMWLILTKAVLAEVMSAFACPKVYYRLIHASCVLPLSEWAQNVEQEIMENIKGTELLLTHLRMNMFCILSSWTKLARNERVLRLWLLVAAW